MKEGKKKKTGKKEIYAVCEHFLNTSFGIKQKIFAFKKKLVALLHVTICIKHL